MQMNRVVIAGYVSKKPEVRRLPSGTPVANVRVGESVRHAHGSEETRELTNWHSLSFYGKLADVAQALKRGDNVYVDGRIEQRQFIARDGSKPRTVHESTRS
jgi:single-strand DNA-binding protein